MVGTGFDPRDQYDSAPFSEGGGAGAAPAAPVGGHDGEHVGGAFGGRPDGYPGSHPAGRQGDFPGARPAAADPSAAGHVPPHAAGLHPAAGAQAQIPPSWSAADPAVARAADPGRAWNAPGQDPAAAPVGAHHASAAPAMQAAAPGWPPAASVPAASVPAASVHDPAATAHAAAHATPRAAPHASPPTPPRGAPADPTATAAAAAAAASVAAAAAREAFHAAEQPPAPSGPGLFATLAGWAGAITSVTLVAGLGLWGWQIAMRDVSDVPVIRAMKGDYRVRPEDPGGEIAANTGLAVNRVQSEGTVASPPDSVVLAPDPMPLAPEDRPQLRVAEARPGTPRPAPRAHGGGQAAGQGLQPPPSGVEDVAYTAPAPSPEQTRKAINALVAEALSRPAAAPDPEAARRLARLPGVKRSPRPRPRPGRAQGVPPTRLAALPGTGDGVAARVVPGALDPVEVDPATVAPGTHLVQLGAFDSVDQARAAWDVLMRRHGDLMRGRKRLIERAESGGRPFYRLRMTGFESRADARRFCSALLARNTSCIYTTAR